jgi:predicted SnoaL-like aldol condensation-catalyzing enzyme
MEAHLRKNKKTVVKFHDLLINKKDFESAKKYVGDSLKQHKPYVPDGVEGLRIFVEYLKAEFPDARTEIKKVIVHGDYVVLYVHLTRALAPQKALVEIFRLEDGKICEHWAVARQAPEVSIDLSGILW